MRAALVLLVLAACGSDTPGMRLDIGAGGTSAARVEIYLGRAKCPDCQSIQPQFATDTLDGDGYFLDGSATAGTPETGAAMDAGHAVFDLRAPAGQDVAMPVVVVVGLDAAGKVVGAEKLTDVVIPAGSTVWWKLDLKPATDQVASDDPLPKGRRVQVWRRGNPDAAACVDYELSDGASDPDRTWLVPEDDTDCDDVPAATECDPLVYKATGTAPINSAHCVENHDTIPGTQGPTCLLGGTACIDGMPQDTNTACVRIDPDYCVPNLLCTDPGCRASPAQCMVRTMMPAMTQMVCEFPVDVTTGAPCQGNTNVTVQLDSFLLHPSDPMQQVTCDDVNFADLTLMRPVLSNTLSVGGTVIRRDGLAPNAACKFPVTLLANTTNVAGGSHLVSTFADLKLSNDNHILLPFMFALHGADCTQADAPSCAPIVNPGETLQNCTAP